MDSAAIGLTRLSRAERTMRFLVRAFNPAPAVWAGVERPYDDETMDGQQRRQRPTADSNAPWHQNSSCVTGSRPDRIRNGATMQVFTLSEIEQQRRAAGGPYLE